MTALYRRPGVLDKFLEDMQFREEFASAAQDTLGRIRQEHAEMTRKKKKKKKKKKKGKKKGKSDLVFVGIHCRRTDHIAYEKRFGKVHS